MVVVMTGGCGMVECGLIPDQAEGRATTLRLRFYYRGRRMGTAKWSSLVSRYLRRTKNGARVRTNIHDEEFPHAFCQVKGWMLMIN